MLTLLPAVLLVAPALPASPAPEALTDRYFRDFTVYSPGRKLRLEAKSPDNAGERSRPFAANFTYTLYDEATKAKLWERKQPMKDGWFDGEASPTGAWVTDAGEVVLVTGWDQLVSLSAKDGARLGMVAVLDQFPKEEQEKYVDMTTAGPMWHGASRWSFLTVKDAKGATALYFVVQPFWERRVVMDVAAGALVDLGAHATCGEQKPEDPKLAALVEAIRADDAAWALRTLERLAKKPGDQKDWDSWRDANAAVRIAGRRALKEAVKPLRKLEQSGEVSSSSSGGVENRGLRGAVHTALRRLGEVPESEPAISLRKSNPGEFFADGAAVTSTVKIKDRSQGADKVKAGISVDDLAAAIGLPDYEVFDATMGHALDYDVDAKEPFTLRVTIEDNAVRSVRKITPPVWKDGFERERGR